MAETTVSDADMMAELGYVPIGPCHGPESDGRCVDGADERVSAESDFRFWVDFVACRNGTRRLVVQFMRSHPL